MKVRLIGRGGLIQDVRMELIGSPDLNVFINHSNMIRIEWDEKRSTKIDSTFEFCNSYRSHLQVLYARSFHALFPASNAGSKFSTGYVSVSRSISSSFTTLVRFSTFHPTYMTSMMGNST